MKKEKIAIVLMNLGGPSNLGEVKQFLFSLFFDKRIIDLPKPFRWIIAQLISTLRTSKATEIYKKLGGKSPIVSNTKKQAKDLSDSLKNEKNKFEVFIAMRHSNPNTSDAIKRVKKFSPDKILLLPLYPQFSSTTTLSAFEEFEREQQKDDALSKVETHKICCYYDDKKFIKSQIELIKDVFMSNKLDKKSHRVLFSAHGLPCSVIEKGDPYQWQIEENVNFIMKDKFFQDVDYRVCYQSKVGVKKWLGPSTEEEIQQAAEDKVGVVIVPIAFVSEHSETLVELDIDYKDLAQKCGVKGYFRVQTQGEDKNFIESLRSICLKSLTGASKKSSNLKRCPKEFCLCINS